MTNKSEETKPKVAHIPRHARTYKCYQCGKDIVVGEDSYRIVMIVRNGNGWPNVAIHTKCEKAWSAHPQSHQRGRR